MSLTIFPILVAALVTSDPSYVHAEIFFTVMSLLGVAVCIWMWYVDIYQLGGVLDKAPPGRRASISSPISNANAYQLLDVGQDTHSDVTTDDASLSVHSVVNTR
jgi:hypothetical protein